MFLFAVIHLENLHLVVPVHKHNLDKWHLRTQMKQNDEDK